MAVPASIANQYRDAVNSGRTDEANYFAQIIATMSGININKNSVTAAPKSMMPSQGYGQGPSVSMDIPKGFFSGGEQKGFLEGLMDFPLFGGGIHSYGEGTSPNDLTGGKAGEVVAGVTSTVGGVGRLLAIVTDLPRMLSLILGVALIIIGLLALNNRTIISAINTVKP